MVSAELIIISDLKKGNEMLLTAGKYPDEYKYHFKLMEASNMPLCELMQTDPFGDSVGPFSVVLQGSGNFTTLAQNPMQRADWFNRRAQQDIAMSIGYGVLRLGGFIIIKDPDDYTGDILQLQPEITAIDVL